MLSYRSKVLLLRDLTFIKERDDALYKAYVTALRQPDVKSHQQAIEVAANSPTSQFWIEPYRAYLEILWRENGYRPKPIRTYRKQLVDDLYEAYLSVKNLPLFRGCSIFFVSQYVVGLPARSFYMSGKTAKRIINRKRREKRRGK